MRHRLAQAVCHLEALERTPTRVTPLRQRDGRALLLVTVGYIATMLSVPTAHLSELLLFASYPILTARLAGVRYATLVRQSLIVVPFVAGVGIFNLFEQTEPVFRIGPVTVTAGWITLLSIVLRGLLSLQALLLLIRTTGWHRLCRTLQRIGVPEPFTTQLLFVHRYLCVLLREGITLSMAREARSFGCRSYPLRVWGPLIGQLLLRTFDRAERIGQAMAARGFTGRMPDPLRSDTRWQTGDTHYLLAWGALFAALRLLSPERIF